MCVRLVVLLSLYFCHLGEVEATLELGGVTGFIVDNGVTALNLPGYMGILTSKSTLLTYLLHKMFGNSIEKKFETIIKIAAEQIPNRAPISDVNNDNEEKMTFHNGQMIGLKSIRVTPGTNVKVIWGSQGIPTAVVSVQFTALKVTGDIHTKFFLKTVHGPAEMKFLDNNFALKFRLYPGLFEWCYLKMHDVILTDVEEASWVVKDNDGDTDSLAAVAMQGYFSSTEHEVENHIKTSIANVIYHEIPKASPAICDNTKKTLRNSKYETFVKKKESTSLGGSDVTNDQTSVQ